MSAAARRLIVLGTLLWAIGPGPARAQEGDPDLASFDAAWRLVYESHFDTTFNGVDWPAVRDELRPHAIGAPRDTVRRLIRAMLGRLGQSHFALIPQDQAESPSGGGGGGTAGLDVRLLDDRMIVTAVDAEGPATGAGVQAGWEVVAVDSQRVDDLLARLRKRESRYPDTFRAPSVVSGWLQGEPGTDVVVEFRDLDDRTVVRRLPRGPAPGELVKFGDFPGSYARFAARAARSPAGREVGVIWFSSWMAPLMRQVDSAVHAFRGMAGMVLDLRGNRGGIGAMITGIAGHFTERRDTLGLFRSRQATLAFAANPRRAAPDGQAVKPFLGPVAILIDPLSASASEILAGGMQAVGRARVFGTTSLGGVLPARWDRLPNGDVLYHAIADFVTATGTVLEGRGVIPDEPVVVTRDDVAHGRDPALAAALRWIDASREAHTPGGTP